jgi:hypothetical protein
MASITAAGKHYPLGDLTAIKALAIMRLWNLVSAAGDNPSALASPDSLAAIVALCKAFGLPADDLALHDCIKAAREIIAAGALQWGEYLAGPVRAEIELTQLLADQVLQGLKGAPNGTSA